MFCEILRPSHKFFQKWDINCGPRSLIISFGWLWCWNTFSIIISEVSWLLMLFTHDKKWAILVNRSITKQDAPPRDWSGMRPHTSECAQSSRLDSRGVHVGWGTDICFLYWQCSQNLMETVVGLVSCCYYVVWLRDKLSAVDGAYRRRTYGSSLCRSRLVT